VSRVRSGVHFPDGNVALSADIPAMVEMVEKTARWIHPNTFHSLPVWAPQIARKQARYTADGKRNRSKSEGNDAAIQTIKDALDVARPYPKNWTVCHIWGYDDPKFALRGSVTQDPRFYSCVGNMIWLPTPLKGFTDAVPAIKAMLRTCAYYLYGWACEHPDVAEQAEAVRSGPLPEHYPQTWPHACRPNTLPLGISQYSENIERAIAKRKAQWRVALDNPNLENYPREQVRDVLAFWQIEIGK